jgi:predicted phage baseplate assembly protein
VAGIGPESRVFLPEIETDGQAYLLFGDGTNGTHPEPGARFTTSYRVGNGTAGNCAREAIVLLDRNAVPAGVTGVINPMPAWGGADPESIDSVRQHAPVAFRTQERAVTPADYAARAAQYPGVRRAAATLRWTGSWHTVLVTVERDQQLALSADLISGLETYLDTYRMAGMDVEVAEATRVPLHLAMTVCVQPDYVSADVESALLDVFSTRTRQDGTPGLLSPDRLDLAAPFYLSPLIAAAQDTDGVTSVQVTAFERQDQPSTDGLTAGVLIPQRLEFFVLDNDPNYPERGRFDLTVEGGL